MTASAPERVTAPGGGAAGTTRSGQAAKAAVLVVARMNFAPATAPASVMAKAATVAVATDN